MFMFYVYVFCCFFHAFLITFFSVLECNRNNSDLQNKKNVYYQFIDLSFTMLFENICSARNYGSRELYLVDTFRTTFFQKSNQNHRTNSGLIVTEQSIMIMIIICFSVYAS